jgi:hypothetical protein
LRGPFEERRPIGPGACGKCVTTAGHPSKRGANRN